MHSLETLNNRFYSDSNQRTFYLQKAEDLYKATLGYAPNPQRILTLGRSWLSEYLFEEGIETVTPAQIEAGDKFDLIIALDEVLTRDADEQSQKKHIMQVAGLLKSDGILMSSLRDYRNTNCHRRPMGDACFNILGDENIVTVEINELNAKDKQSWTQKIHVVSNDTDFTCIDAGPRRTLYFKQLAKYCADSGADKFGIMKDIYWKGHLRRTPEHVTYARAK